MATTTKTGPALTPYRFTVKQFEAMISAEIIPEEANVELIAGVLCAMTKYEPHCFSSGMLVELILPLVPSGCHLSHGIPHQSGRFWMPIPDLTLMRGSRRDARPHRPDAALAALVIEVADTTYPKDRGLKWRRYAAARIPVYWIVNLPGRVVEVYTDPDGQGSSALYRACATYSEADHASVVIDSREVGRVAVRDILP